MELISRILPGQDEPAAQQRVRAILLTAVFATVLAAVEIARLAGKDPPFPFLLLIGSAALAAALSGLRTGLVCAAFSCAYIAWAALQDFGPPAMTSNPLRVVLSCLATFLMIMVLGYEYDARNRLLQLLRKRESELLVARERLSSSVAETTRYLERTRGELSDTRYQIEQAMRFAPIGIATIDADQQLQFINDAALAQFGTGKLPDHITGWNTLVDQIQIYDVKGQRLVSSDGPVIAALTAGTSEVDFEARVVGFDGETRWSSGYIGPVRNTRHDVNGAVIMLVDTTVQKDVARALQQLTRLLFKVQEEERGKLSRELHEQIGQSLTAIKFSLYNSIGDDTGSAQLEASMAQLDALTNNVRQLALDLRPTSLDDFGLVSAIEAFVDRVRASGNSTVTLQAVENLAAMSDETAIVAYRVVQEGVENAIHHARATRVEIRLFSERDRLHVMVSDNGRGFDVEAARLKSPGSGQLGLLFMQERVRQCDGVINITSNTTNGTQISASLPLNSGAKHAESAVGTDRRPPDRP